MREHPDAALAVKEDPHLGAVIGDNPFKARCFWRKPKDIV